MDKSREQFEEWAKSIPLANLKRHLDGYENQSINSHWSTWQASRAALVVKLPPQHEWVLDGYDAIEVSYALKQAGIKCS